MATFPITKARQKLGFTPATSVRANIDTRTGQGAVGKAVGEGVLELYAQWDLKIANTQLSKYQRDVGLDDILLVKEIGDELDPEKHSEIHQQHAKSRQGMMPKNRRAAKAAAIWNNKKEVEYAESLTNGMELRINDNWLAEYSAKVAELAGGQGSLTDTEKFLARRQLTDPLDKTVAAKLLASAQKAEVEGLVTRYYRNGFYVNARETLEASSLSQADKEDLEDEIDQDEKKAILEFEYGINNELVAIDNAPNMTQADFNNQASKIKTDILTYPHITGTQRKKMLSDLDRWKRGTNEIDYAKILSLNQEMDAAQRSGIVDPTIKNRITDANLEGAFGGRHRGGQKTYGDMVRRFNKLQFDERAQSITPIVRTFERENRDDPRLIFLFHQAKNKIMTDNTDMASRELFVKISGLAESYSILPEKDIVQKMKKDEAGKIIMVSPEGKLYEVPPTKRQLFIDNGYTEK